MQAEMHATAYPRIIANEQSEYVDVAVLGDLHLKEDAMEPFHQARAHFQVRSCAASAHARLVHSCALTSHA